jgi:hypothetical protein
MWSTRFGWAQKGVHILSENRNHSFQPAIRIGDGKPPNSNKRCCCCEVHQLPAITHHDELPQGTSSFTIHPPHHLPNPSAPQETCTTHYLYSTPPSFITTSNADLTNHLSSLSSQSTPTPSLASYPLPAVVPSSSSRSAPPRTMKKDSCIVPKRSIVST